MDEDGKGVGKGEGGVCIRKVVVKKTVTFYK